MPPKKTYSKKPYEHIAELSNERMLFEKHDRKIFLNDPEEEFEVEYYGQKFVDGKAKDVLILNNLIDSVKLAPAFALLSNMIGKEKVVALNMHKVKWKVFYIRNKGTAYEEKVYVDIAMIKRYWITGRGIGKSWWPHTNFNYESKLGIMEDSAFLVKALNEASFPVRASLAVAEEVEELYNINFEQYITRNETQQSGFIKHYDIPYEDTRKTKNFKKRTMLSGSFEALTKLAHRVNEVRKITRVYADELVSHKSGEIPPDKETWFEDYEKSIFGSLFKKAKDTLSSYCFDAFMNKWDKNFPVIEYADSLIDYDGFVKNWYMEDLVNNNFIMFYVVQDRTAIINASKFNSMVIRANKDRQDDLLSKAKKAIDTDDQYALAEILGDVYEGAEIGKDFIYRNSIQEDFEYGIIDGSKEPIVDIGIDIDPNKVIEIAASQLVWVGNEPHINTYALKSIPINFKGRYPTKDEQDNINKEILESISEITLDAGLYVRNVMIDDNFGWIVGGVEGLAHENGIYDIVFDKPRQKKDEWNILTRQLFFNKFMARGNLHFIDDHSTRELLTDFKNIKKQKVSAANAFRSVNKRQDGNDHKINAWEYSLQYFKDAFYGVDDFMPVKTDYIN